MEGIYVPCCGVSAKTVDGFLRLIKADLERGYTYDHSCRVIPMTPRLAERRALYLIALARKHAPHDVDVVREKVYRFLGRRRAPVLLAA